MGVAGISPSACAAVVGEVDALNDFFAKLDDESHAGVSRMREARAMAGLGGLMSKLWQLLFLLKVHGGSLCCGHLCQGAHLLRRACSDE